jgi:hypothetical protein
MPLPSSADTPHYLPSTLCCLPQTPLLLLQLQQQQQPELDANSNEAIMQEVLQDYMSKAEAYKADLGDNRLTVEHLMMAMAEVDGMQGGRKRARHGGVWGLYCSPWTCNKPCVLSGKTLLCGISG